MIVMLAAPSAIALSLDEVVDARANESIISTILVSRPM